MTRTPAVMEIELKPCPFCGSDAIMMRDDGSCYKVQCSEAWCFAERACWRQTERAAIKDWNHRTPAEPLADGEMIETVARAIVAALKEDCTKPNGECYAVGDIDAMEIDGEFDPEVAARAAIAAYNPNDRLEAENAELRAERDALLQKPIDLAKMDSIDEDASGKMVAYYWWQQAQDARVPNERLREALEGIERIAEKHTGVSGSRSLQTAMLAISFAAHAALSHKD